MALAPGTKLGPFEILAPLGAGGMGEVYRARDGNLKRDVALKVLPDAFATDPERMARFQREAEVLASLNHPNIAHIYGVETRAIAMELVEGGTLKGPLPVETVLLYARQIAEALEYAHERGVMHRDLKPANVKVTADGAVKLLDFGLAKAVEDPILASSDTVNSPTLTLGATRVGVILGTAAYMSPEQASGKPADRRADIWSFGAVLYEMLSGKRAFSGESVSDTLATVLKLEPDWNALPSDTPIAIRQLVRRCLIKDRKQRLQAIGEARIAIEQTQSAGASEVALETRAVFLPRRYSWLWPCVAALFFIVAAALGYLYYRERPANPAEATRFQVFAPDKGGFGSYLGPSPDGRKLAFSAPAPDGRLALWIRPIDSLEARIIAGTEGLGGIPFWSADSQSLAFGAGGKLKKIDSGGGAPLTLCDFSGVVVGGAWNREGVIVVGTGAGGLFRVPAAGGLPVPITVLNQTRNESRHLLPAFLPDGRHFIYTRIAGGADNSGIYVGSIDIKPEEQPDKPLLGGVQFGAVYVPAADSSTGRLLFVRGDTLMAQPFDLGKLQLIGQPVPVAERVGTYINFSLFGASPNVLAYRTGGSGGFQLAWYDREGKLLSDTGAPGEYFSVALSPDGTRVVASRADPQTGNVDLWLHDLARGVPTRFTFDQDPELDAVWSPDGRSVVFDTYGMGLFQKPSSGAGSQTRLLQSKGPIQANDWSRDGRFLLYSAQDSKTKSDLWVLPMEGDRQPVSYLKTSADESEGQFSPDGRFVAYRSDESGGAQVFVQPFPATAGGGGKWQVSNDGGEQPRWRRDGKELFYVTADRTIMAVDVTTTPSFQAGIPKPLFSTNFRGSNGNVFRWDVSADGRKFLIVSADFGTGAAPIAVVLNWQSGLRK